MNKTTAAGKTKNASRSDEECLECTDKECPECTNEECPEHTNEECHRIIILIDESGSMTGKTKDIVDGVNEMIHQQRQVKPEINNQVRVNIITFSTTVNTIIEDSLDRIRDMAYSDYAPEGLTALWDALGNNIVKYRNESNVIVFIATDGVENFSKKFSQETIKKLINEQRTLRNWNFIYFSEDRETTKQGDSIGLVHGATGCNNIAVGSSDFGQTMSATSFNASIGLIRSGQHVNLLGKFDSLKLSSADNIVEYRSPYPSCSAYSACPTRTRGLLKMSFAGALPSISNNKNNSADVVIVNKIK